MAATTSKDFLRSRFVGRHLQQVPTPALVLDLAKVEANCNLMLDAVQRLDLSWRAHIKTHKTTELTRLQVGDESSSPVNIVVSTLLEAENIVPLLKEYQESSRLVNVLFGFPIYASCVDRLAQVSAQLGPGALSVIVDHIDQLKYVTSLASKSRNRPLIFLKVDVGSNRAGVIPGSSQCVQLIDQLLIAEAVGSCELHGVYAHASQSYYTRTDWEALEFLAHEFESLYKVAQVIRKDRPRHPLVLSVGATPTATSIQHPDLGSASSPTASNGTSSKTSRMDELMEDFKREQYTLEVHAGVYTVLDLQQLAAHSRDAKYLNYHCLALSVLVEVASMYPGRGPADTTEVLVSAGTLALGREPCKDRGTVPGKHYSGWGIVTPWNCKGQPAPGKDFPAQHGGWQVSKVTQEHGILSWVDDGSDVGETPLYLGQKLRIWPNHACIAGAGHDYYLVVDSRNQRREDEIVDVWPRWNGWLGWREMV